MPALPVSSICGRSMTRPALSSSSTFWPSLLTLGLSRNGFDFGGGTEVDRARGAVDDNRVAGIGDADGVGRLADGRNAKRAGYDGDMRVGGAFFQHEAAQPFAIIVEQRRRTHRARDENGVVRQLFARGRVVLPGELAHQAMAEIFEIVQAFAKVGIGGAQHPRARIGLHALDRRFRRDAGGDGVAQASRPARIVGEHAIGFEDIAMLAAVGDIAALQHSVEIAAQLGQRRIEPLEFARHVLGDVVGDDDARLVQHDMAERDALRQDRTVEMQRMARGGLRARPRQRRQFARGDHLGEHHRGGLQRLDFLLDIGAVGAVLHHQHAERVAGAQDRHAEEGVVDFFAGFRAVRERRMRLRVGQVQRRRFAGDEADEAFMRVQHGLVDGLAVEALGGVEFERAVVAQHVHRADFRHHVGGDDHDDLVEFDLRCLRLRHHFPEPSEEDTRADCGTDHETCP